MLPTTDTLPLPYPQGDPEALLTAAHSIAAAATECAHLAPSVSTTSSGLLASWVGSAATAFATVSTATIHGINDMSPVHEGASIAITRYAGELEIAQHASARAQQIYNDAQSAFNGYLRTSTPSTPPVAPLTPTEIAAAAHALQSAQDTLSTETTRAQRMADEAVTDAHTAAARAAHTLQGLKEKLGEMWKENFAAILGTPGFLLSIHGLPDITDSSRNLVSTLSTLHALGDANFDALIAKNEGAFAGAFKAANEFGENSPQAIRAWMLAREATSLSAVGKASDAGMELLHAFSGLSRVAGDGSALTALSKITVGATIIGDVANLANWHDEWDKSGAIGKTDEVASIANIGGLGMYAVATEAGGAAMGAIGLDTAAAFIPGVGEVVLGATALYFVGSMVYEHWDDIKSAGASVVNDIKWLDGKEVEGFEDVEGAIASKAEDVKKDVESGIKHVFDPADW